MEQRCYSICNDVWIFAFWWQKYSKNILENFKFGIWNARFFKCSFKRFNHKNSKSRSFPTIQHRINKKASMVQSSLTQWKKRSVFKRRKNISERIVNRKAKQRLLNKQQRSERRLRKEQIHRQNNLILPHPKEKGPS